MQSFGLQNSSNKDARFTLNVRMLIATAFVPKNDVCDAFDQLVRSQYYDDNEDVLEPLINYFERTWIGVLSRTGKRRLRSFYPIKLWNYFEAVRNEVMRTNNAFEGWHHSFNRKVRISHAIMPKYFSVIVCEQTIIETLLTQLNTGLNLAAKKMCLCEY